MFFSWLKSYMPRGLYGRAALILLVPVIGLQTVVSVTFIQRQFEDVTRQMVRNVVLEVNYLLDEVERAPDLEAALLIGRTLGGPLALNISLADTPGEYVRYWYDISGITVNRTLHETVDGIQWIDLSANRRVDVGVESVWGVLRLTFDRRRVSAANPHQLLVLMAFTGIFMTLIAFAFLRNQLRPIRRLAHAAEAFGKGQKVDYSPSGATEVRSAGNAFLDMRNRIERQIEQRTMMLSGVSHDLRTPLTRLKLGLSLMDEKEVAELDRDVDDMQALLDSFLDFARGDATEEMVTAMPSDLARDVADDAARTGHIVRFLGQEGLGAERLRPVAVRRALTNLVSNAARHGSETHVSVTSTPTNLKFTVEDNGPGIPEELRETALRPFARLDRSRNQDQGPGVGLGLSIAADIARSHGGTLRLGQSKALGGLSAELILAKVIAPGAAGQD